MGVYIGCGPSSKVIATGFFYSVFARHKAFTYIPEQTRKDPQASIRITTEQTSEAGPELGVLACRKKD